MVTVIKGKSLVPCFCLKKHMKKYTLVLNFTLFSTFERLINVLFHIFLKITDYLPIAAAKSLEFSQRQDNHHCQPSSPSSRMKPISFGELDRPATPILSGDLESGCTDEPLPPRPPLPKHFAGRN